VTDDGRIEITDDVWITEAEIEETFVRASGPGGQNVNKVSTAVQLRFDAMGSPHLPEGVKNRLPKIAGRRMTEEGMVIITANRFRTQLRNRVDARDRLVEMLRQAATPPARRIATRPTLGAKRKRLDEKKRRGEVKAMRRGKPPTD
jgi:ribosome-associated protein